MSAVALVFALSACGSSGDSTDGAAEPANTDPKDTTGDAGDAGTGTLTIETDTGESWTLVQDTCSYNPDGEGDIVELWGASADVPSGGGFTVSLFTVDPTNSDLFQFSGALFDEAQGVAYYVNEGEAVSDGSTMTMTLGMYSSNEWELGDPIDLTATVTCQL